MRRETDHTPVLKEEVVSALLAGSPTVVVDGTAGSGGHTNALADGMGEGCVLLAIDADPDAVGRLRERFKTRPIVRVRHGSYANLISILQDEGLRSADAILLDLGFSSAQIAASNRGFSFALDGPLDMRFDPTSGLPTAAEVLNSFSEKQLAELFWKYAEEPRSRRIARAIVVARKRTAILRTSQLADLVADTVGRKSKPRLHPATRIFQALRVFVNRELENLATFMNSIPACLGKDGRVCIISYHSLEDRIVKTGFRRMAENGSVEILTAKPIRPTAREIALNPRARSARMRVAVRL